MPSAVSQNPQSTAAAPDDLDNLFNYDDAVEDFLQDLPIEKDQQNNNSVAQEPAKNIDEEITVKKKRKPVPKLDEARLLSQAGIPKLRKITKSRLKFRGKGHEFSDISRLLNTYQLWLDDLYPREKFRDALGRVEKLGHSKRMQITRRAWLDATKPHQREASPERIRDAVMSGALPERGVGTQRNGADESDDAIFGDLIRENSAAKGSEKESQTNDAPEDDELDALLADNEAAVPSRTAEAVQRRREPFEEVDDDEDDLNALLAGNGASVPSKSTEPPQRHGGPFEEEDSDEDELDALLAEVGPRNRPELIENHRGLFEKSDPKHDELAASMAQEIVQNVRRNDPDQDELDAEMADRPEDITPKSADDAKGLIRKLVGNIYDTMGDELPPRHGIVQDDLEDDFEDDEEAMAGMDDLW